MENNFLRHYHGFSINEIASFFVGLPSDIPIVSVGSGRGELEKSLLNQLPNLRIITIDPDPSSYAPKDLTQLSCQGLPPQYDYVSTLIKKQPTIVRNCVLLLPWPFPNKSYYDYESLIDLQPQYVIAIYEIIGGACGHNFHNWLRSFDSTYQLTWSSPMQLDVLPVDEYKLCSFWKNFATNGLVIEGIVMLSRSDVKVVDNHFGNYVTRGLKHGLTEEKFVDQALINSCSIA